MNKNNLGPNSDKLSMGLSVFIALCVVSLFCAISIVVIESIDYPYLNNMNKQVSLPSSKEPTDFMI